MADFMPITTQEEFDARIKDRLERISNKYADYDNIKAELEVERNKNADALAKIATHETTINELTGKIANYELASVKTRVAMEHGLPYEMASRLNGTDEETIARDAEALSKMFSVRSVQPIASKEVPPVDSKTAALKSLAQELKTN